MLVADTEFGSVNNAAVDASQASSNLPINYITVVPSLDKAVAGWPTCGSYMLLRVVLHCIFYVGYLQTACIMYELR